MKKQRPVNLNLLTIRFPIPAIISILHRIAGVVLFLFIPFILWLLQQSLESFDTFIEVRDLLTTPWAAFIIWGLMACFIYHLFAGIRHLLMDWGWGETLTAGRRSAKMVLVLTIIFIIAVGVWLW